MRPKATLSVCDVVPGEVRRVGAAPALWVACRAAGTKRTGERRFGVRGARGREATRRLQGERERIARRASALGHRGHNQRALGCSDGHFNRVLRANHLRGLYALAVHVYPSPENTAGRCAPRLEHAGCPEPFVDPHLVHSAMIAVARGLPADRGARAGHVPRKPKPRPALRFVESLGDRAGELERALVAGLPRLEGSLGDHGFAHRDPLTRPTRSTKPNPLSQAPLFKAHTGLERPCYRPFSASQVCTGVCVIEQSVFD